jgi:sarcosine oxidase subunit beta
MEKIKMVNVREAAVVVVGGGIMGCATAYELAKKGRSVVLLEKGFVGAEASGRNGGGVRQQKRDPAELPLAMESVKIWQGLHEELEWDLEYRQSGNLHILGNPDRYDFFIEQLQYSQKVGLDVRLLSPGETRKLLPTLRMDLELLGATYCPSDGNANPLFVCKAYAKAARQLGVEIREHEPLEQLEVKSGRVIAAVTATAEYRASDFVIAAGAWSRPICHQIGHDFPVEIKRSQLMVTEPLPAAFSEFVSADQCSCYYRQALNGGIHIGIPSAPVEDDKKSTSYDAFKIVGQSCMTLFPFLERVNIVHSWAGLTNWTPDAVCIIDKAPDVEGFYLTAGHSGHGFCLGPITGRLLAEWIVDGAPSMDLSAVRWTRFNDIYLNER